MDRRGWLWKRKSPKEVTRTNEVADQGNSKNVVDYIQLSRERYAYLSEMEDQVKVLNGKLSDALSEVTTKEKLVKQHTKVAEEAISGWEKAEANATSLKTELESVTLLKLTAEDKAVNLDGALKECMKQVRSVKEQGEQKLNDVVSEKTKQWEKERFMLEMKIDVFEKEIENLSAENDALSRSLQQHSEMLVKVNEEKCQVDAENDTLKLDVQSYEREINSLKYEVHVVSKELEIRNEEKNMCARSADVANKRHLEDIKKITKLEAESQKLRGLIRKKLPGPAAVTKMKEEVEKFSRDFGEDRSRQPPFKCYSPRSGSIPDFVFENVQQLRKENEVLINRLVSMEEETKMLKESLSDRNTVLQVSQENFAEASYHKIRSKSERSISMSDNGIDEGSCSESWGTTSLLEFSHLRKDSANQDVIKSNKPEQLELMDDFLEMEKLASLPTELNRSNFALDNIVDWSTVGNSGSNRSVDGISEVKSQKAHQPYLSPTRSPTSFNMQESAKKTITVQTKTFFSKLHSEIALVFESQGDNVNIKQLLMDVENILQNLQKDLPQHSVGFDIEEVQLDDAPCDGSQCHKTNNSSSKKCFLTKDEEIERAILQIHDFVVSLGKEAIEAQGMLSNSYVHFQKIGEISSAIDKLLSIESSGDEFLKSLTSVLLETKELCYGIFHGKVVERESNSSDCIDKLTLQEKKIVQNRSGKDQFADSSSEILHDGGYSRNSEKMEPGGHPLRDFERVKQENENLIMEIARLNESLEQKRQDLLKSEEKLASLESQLATCQKSNSLADSQLKCMTESYTSLESHCRHLEDEIKVLEKKVETLDHELQEERHSHSEDLAKYKGPEEHTEGEDKKFPHPEDEIDLKIKQEREIAAAAADKLSECQETILLLGKQLKAMNSKADFRRSTGERDCTGDGLCESIPSADGSVKVEPNSNPQVQQNPASILQRTGCEHPLGTYSYHFGTSNTDSMNMQLDSSKRHRSLWSSFSNTSSEKHARGFGRLFSKGKGER